MNETVAGRNGDYRDEGSWLGRLANVEPKDIEIRQILLTLWRRRIFILAMTGLVTIIAILVVAQIKPRYTATTQAMIESRQNKVTDIESVVSGLSPDMAAVLSEVEVIRSRSLLERLVFKLALHRDPEFNADLKKEPAWRAYFKPETYIPLDWLISLGLEKARANPAAL